MHLTYDNNDLTVSAILLALGQMFNVPALRITKGGNEISPEEIEVSSWEIFIGSKMAEGGDGVAGGMIVVEISFIVLM